MPDEPAPAQHALPASLDVELAELARRVPEDPAAFRKLVLRTQNELVRYAARVMGNLAEAEDVVQDAYVKAHGSLVVGQFDGRARLHTWLYSIVTHGAINVLRSGRRRRELAAQASAEAFGGQLPAAEAQLAQRELDAWLERLPPEQRTALVLKHIEGHSAREIAEICGCSEGAVEQRLVRARAALAAHEAES